MPRVVAHLCGRDKTPSCFFFSPGAVDPCAQSHGFQHIPDPSGVELSPAGRMARASPPPHIMCRRPNPAAPTSPICHAYSFPPLGVRIWYMTTVCLHRSETLIQHFPALPVSTFREFFMLSFPSVISVPPPHPTLTLYPDHCSCSLTSPHFIVIPPALFPSPS